MESDLQSQNSDILELDAQDMEDLEESAGLLIDSLINRDPMRFIRTDFHESICGETRSLLQCQLPEVDYEEAINVAIEHAFTTCYSHICPRRSHTTSFIRTVPNKDRVQDRLNHLKNIPQPDQRTPEWYKFRHNYVTASSAWKAFLSSSSQNQLIYDKCQPYNSDKSRSGGNLDSPMQWGIRYEPVSIQWYETEYKTKIDDFGCLPHSHISCLAASPDGINTDPNSSRFGRMLEVKNIVNREINGNPKLEYWIQMQLQMEVCGLNECDFLETRFKEYEGLEEFLVDGDFQCTIDGRMKGIIMYFTR